MIECVVQDRPDRDWVNVFFFERDGDKRIPFVVEGAKLQARPGMAAEPNSDLPISLGLTSAQADLLVEALLG